MCQNRIFAALHITDDKSLCVISFSACHPDRDTRGSGRTGRWSGGASTSLKTGPEETFATDFQPQQHETSVSVCRPRHGRVFSSSSVI